MDTGHTIAKEDPLLVLIGPSAVGKTSLVQALQRKNRVLLTPSWTTRPLRTANESESDHVFVDEVAFHDAAASGFFVETAQLFGMPFWYGLPKVKQGGASEVPVVVLRAAVLPLVYQHYPSAIVYQIEAPKQLVKQRISERGGSEEDIAKRLALYDQELQTGRAAAHRVFVNDGSLESLLHQVIQAIEEDFR